MQLEQPSGYREIYRMCYGLLATQLFFVVGLASGFSERSETVTCTLRSTLAAYIHANTEQAPCRERRARTFGLARQPPVFQ